MEAALFQVPNDHPGKQHNEEANHMSGRLGQPSALLPYGCINNTLSRHRLLEHNKVPMKTQTSRAPPKWWVLAPISPLVRPNCARDIETTCMYRARPPRPNELLEMLRVCPMHTFIGQAPGGMGLEQTYWLNSSGSTAKAASRRSYLCDPACGRGQSSIHLAKCEYRMPVVQAGLAKTRRDCGRKRRLQNQTTSIGMKVVRCWMLWCWCNECEARLARCATMQLPCTTRQHPSDARRSPLHLYLRGILKRGGGHTTHTYERLSRCRPRLWRD